VLAQLVKPAAPLSRDDLLCASWEPVWKIGGGSLMGGSQRWPTVVLCPLVTVIDRP
jgi:hypothetical protein